MLTPIEHLLDLAERAEASELNRSWGARASAELVSRAERERAWIDELSRPAGGS